MISYIISSSCESTNAIWWARFHLVRFRCLVNPHLPVKKSQVFTIFNDNQPTAMIRCTKASVWPDWYSSRKEGKFNVIRTFSVFRVYMVSYRREPRGDMEATLHRTDTVIREPESLHPWTSSFRQNSQVDLRIWPDELILVLMLSNLDATYIPAIYSTHFYIVLVYCSKASRESAVTQLKMSLSAVSPQSKEDIWCYHLSREDLSSASFNWWSWKWKICEWCEVMGKMKLDINRFSKTPNKWRRSFQLSE